MYVWYLPGISQIPMMTTDGQVDISNFFAIQAVTTLPAPVYSPQNLYITCCPD